MNQETHPQSPGRLHPSWHAELADELDAPYMAELRQFLLAEASARYVVYPARRQIFNAFAHTPFERVRVVILGQDPYHGPDQAMGLAFSVPRGIPIPPSLRNIFTELQTSLAVPRPAHGDLTAWADQGVLLLNTALTVRAHEAGSHAGAGWHRFTDAAIRAIAQREQPAAFLLWGRHAHGKAALIDGSHHLVLTAPHPSPLSASKGFFGCGHFARANSWLEARGEQPIDWVVPD